MPTKQAKQTQKHRRLFGALSLAAVVLTAGLFGIFFHATPQQPAKAAEQISANNTNAFSYYKTSACGDQVLTGAVRETGTLAQFPNTWDTTEVTDISLPYTTDYAHDTYLRPLKATTYPEIATPLDTTAGVIKGTIYEDVVANNTVGGYPFLGINTGFGISGVKVELYDRVTHKMLATTTTNTTGVFQFDATTGNFAAATQVLSDKNKNCVQDVGEHKGPELAVRVVTDTVTSPRKRVITPAETSIKAVQTYASFCDNRSSSPTLATVYHSKNDGAWTNANKEDFGVGTLAQPIPQATTTQVIQSWTPVECQFTRDGANMDFGFSFHTVANPKASGTGSLAQAITNTNYLDETKILADYAHGVVAGVDAISVMIPKNVGLQHEFQSVIQCSDQPLEARLHPTPAGYATNHQCYAYLDGSALPPITDNNTTIDGAGLLPGDTNFAGRTNGYVFPEFPMPTPIHQASVWGLLKNTEQEYINFNYSPNGIFPITGVTIDPLLTNPEVLKGYSLPHIVIKGNGGVGIEPQATGTRISNVILDNFSTAIKGKNIKLFSVIIGTIPNQTNTKNVSTGIEITGGDFGMTESIIFANSTGIKSLLPLTGNAYTNNSFDEINSYAGYTIDTTGVLSSPRITHATGPINASVSHSLIVSNAESIALNAGILHITGSIIQGLATTTGTILTSATNIIGSFPTSTNITPSSGSGTRFVVANATPSADANSCTIPTIDTPCPAPWPAFSIAVPTTSSSSSSTPASTATVGSSTSSTSSTSSASTSASSSSPITTLWPDYTEYLSSKPSCVYTWDSNINRGVAIIGNQDCVCRGDTTHSKLYYMRSPTGNSCTNTTTTGTIVCPAPLVATNDGFDCICPQGFARNMTSPYFDFAIPSTVCSVSAVVSSSVSIPPVSSSSSSSSSSNSSSSSSVSVSSSSSSSSMNSSVSSSSSSSTACIPAGGTATSLSRCCTGKGTSTNPGVGGQIGFTCSLADTSSSSSSATSQISSASTSSLPSLPPISISGALPITQVPNAGDANGDNIRDDTQGGVATVPALSDNTALSTIQIGNGSGTPCNQLSIVQNLTNSMTDSYKMPYQLVSFAAPCSGSTTVTIYWYIPPGDTGKQFILRKYGSTILSPNVKGWYSYPATLTRETIGGRPVVKAVYTLTNNQAGDDSLGDALIVDPVTIATDTASSSSTQTATVSTSTLSSTSAKTSGSSTSATVATPLVKTGNSTIIVISLLASILLALVGYLAIRRKAQKQADTIR